MKRPTLVLFDAHAILHRAFHAIPDFTTKNGEPTGALYGLSTLILKTINTFHPEDMVACFGVHRGCGFGA
jgi:DNA polymerase-1